jgi:hypothetical protein
LKIPNDWPLQQVTVKDSKRIGVTESRWRSWILGVQQIIWSQVCVCVCVCCEPGHWSTMSARTDGLSTR